MMALWIVCGAAAAALIWAVVFYNRLVRLRNMALEAWSGVDVQLKRRSDLVPNLVETVKGYAEHEKGALEAVIGARSAVTAAPGAEERMRAENALSSTLRSLFAVAEAYPELKANANFIQLQGELGRIEDEIQMSRRYYNGSVRCLNNAVQQFPGLLLAGPFGFAPMPYYEAEESDRSVPKVSF